MKVVVGEEKGSEPLSHSTRHGVPVFKYIGPSGGPEKGKKTGMGN